MLTELLRLEFKQFTRSTSFGKSLAANLFLGFLAIVLLAYVLLLGAFLSPIIRELSGEADVLSVLQANLILFFLIEFLYRYFLQQLPVLEVERYLLLPLAKKRLVHFLLLRSYVSPLTLIPILLFAPFAFTQLAPEYGFGSAISWFGAIFLSSMLLHTSMLFYKQQFGDSLVGILVVFFILVVTAGGTYLGYFQLGNLFAPVFAWSLQAPWPFLALLAACLGAYRFVHRYYLAHMYVDLLEQEEKQAVSSNLPFLNRFGLAGEMANVEWQLIRRHKKSRTYLIMSAFFLLYGLIIYLNPAYQSEEGFGHFFLFAGIFLTGSFMIQYSQLFLSWNSSNYDFFLTQKAGVEALVKGKFLLFAFISVLCFLVTLPYVYFDSAILLIHLAGLCFNVGVTMPLLALLASWKPKPMDINKGAMFNYEGVGLMQFLMILPIGVTPYLIYFPFVLFGAGQVAGLWAVTAVGLLGILLLPLSTRAFTHYLWKNRYAISASFRQEL
ncbi:MAG: DUF5687 family protein [Nitritalea sp.]